MRKKIAVAGLLICISHFSNAQSFAINTDGSTAHASALLDVKSTTKGVLVPRMSKAEVAMKLAERIAEVFHDPQTSAAE